MQDMRGVVEREMDRVKAECEAKLKAAADAAKEARRKMKTIETYLNKVMEIDVSTTKREAGSHLDHHTSLPATAGSRAARVAARSVGSSRDAAGESCLRKPAYPLAPSQTKAVRSVGPRHPHFPLPQLVLFRWLRAWYHFHLARRSKQQVPLFSFLHFGLALIQLFPLCRNPLHQLPS